eukprot:TRINITY_DN12453_c0_g1_i1.p1 TRINITY_DN12453_c0_g1~~TRINITY_DN12453_c0_g1_i1.p1  ORF type:complete len:261 (+),score=55.41 TRINITY_DN12453_c0_g1_i1:74-856(+)
MPPKNKKKGAKKRITDPFSKKEWYHVKAPAVFPTRNVGRTIATRSSGNKLARDNLIGRCFTVSLGELKPDSEDEAFRKFRLRIDDVSGKQCLTQFHGMSLSTDKLRSLVRKWRTLIEAYQDVVTTDGYRLRLFCLGFTRSRPNQVRETSYAQSGQIRAIRRKMQEIMQREAANCSVTELVQKLIPEVIGKEIEKATQGIYPLQNVLIRKVKVLRRPKTDLQRLLDAHGGAAAVADMGKVVARASDDEEDEEKDMDAEATE